MQLTIKSRDFFSLQLSCLSKIIFAYYRQIVENTIQENLIQQYFYKWATKA